MWVVWCFVAGTFSLALGYHFSFVEMYIWGATLVSWPLLMAGETLLKPESDKYQRCMTHTARMEIETYGMIVSQSVEWWLGDTGTLLCKAHPFPDLPMMVTGHICTCPNRPRPPLRSPRAAVYRGNVSTRHENIDTTHTCTRLCPTDDIIGGNGLVIATYCVKSGRRWEGGAVPPSRPSPTISTRPPNPESARR